MSVLIVTLPGDYHAHAIRWALARLGATCRFLYCADLAGQAEWHFDPIGNSLRIERAGKVETLSTDDYETVWIRRQVGVIPRDYIQDPMERAVSEQDSVRFINGVVGWLEFGKFTVNAVAQNNRAARKSFQLALASKMGFLCPRTIVSNTPDQILAFFDACGGNIVYKPLKPVMWPIAENAKSIVPTTCISDRALLAGADLVSAPSIFQERIDKVSEIRAVVMGRSCFAWEKTFDADVRAKVAVDWRWEKAGAHHRAHELPAALKDKIFAYMDTLDLRYGAFDFAVDANGDYYFLEVNPHGQFLWGDQLGLGFNQLEAFAEFLLSRDASFSYSNSHRFTLADHERENRFEADVEHELEGHFGHVDTYKYGQLSIAMA